MPKLLMLDFNSIAEFSRANCVSICAFLVPANLCTTIVTMIFAALRRPLPQVWQAAAIASICASIMILHVYTWFSIGVVMAPTYILMWLAITCLLTNIAAILFRSYQIKLPQIRRA